ncbi:MAG: Rab family GTPase [Promethearchaeota archaeon]
MNRLYEMQFKLVIAGDGGLGKSTMIKRFLSNEFEENYKMTIGTNFFAHTVDSGEYKVVFLIWDLGGQRRFRKVIPQFLRGAQAVLLCYDSSRYSTFLRLDEWYDMVTKNTNNPIIYLVGTKNELDKSVKKSEVNKWIRDRMIDRRFECSAVTGSNISRIFNTLADDLVMKVIADDLNRFEVAESLKI